MPPYSDNLYSAEGDDVSDGGEPFNDELSPIDGYFTRTEMPSDRLVPDPTIDYGPVEAKSLIDPPNSPPTSGSSSRAPRPHPRSPQLSSSPQYVSRSTMGGSQMSPASSVSYNRRHGSFSENEPLISHPPPAYSESPPSSTSPLSSRSRPSSSFSQPRSYSTFAEQHLERGFLFPRQPQSMGGPSGGPPTERTRLVEGGWIFARRFRKLKAFLFASLVLAVVGSTVAMVLGCTNSDNGLELTPPIREYCPAATTKESLTAYEFSGGKELNIVHKIKEESERKVVSSVSTEGEIRLRIAPPNSAHGRSPYITVDMGKSTKMLSTLRWSKDSQTLELTTPRYSETYATRSPCMYVIITAWFPEDIEITNLRFNSPTLNLALSDVKVNVTSGSTFSTTSGHVWLTTGDDEESQTFSKSSHPALSSRPMIRENLTISEVQFASRRTVVETVSGQITGTYPLLDELLISSQSGKIAVQVSPQPASESAPAPADLEVQTASGNIRVELPIYNTRVSAPGKTLIVRDYITRVHSTSGVVSGNYYLGSESNFKTTSGLIDIVTLPVLPADDGTAKVPPNKFETHTISGTTKVSIMEPIFFSASRASDPSTVSGTLRPNDNNGPYGITSDEKYRDTPKLRSLRSVHSSSTGQIDVGYPSVWEGSVHAKTVSGDIDITGEGFRTVLDRHGWAFKEVEKRRRVDGKGEGSAAELNNISGEVAFIVR